MAFATSRHHHPYLLTGTPIDLVGLRLNPQADPMAPILAVEWFNDLRNGQPFPLLQVKGDLVVENGQAFATFLWLWDNHKIEGIALREVPDGRVTYRVVHSLPGDSPVVQVLQSSLDWLLKAPVNIWRLPDPEKESPILVHER